MNTYSPSPTETPITTAGLAMQITEAWIANRPEADIKAIAESHPKHQRPVIRAIAKAQVETLRHWARRALREGLQVVPESMRDQVRRAIASR